MSVYLIRKSEVLMRLLEPAYLHSLLSLAKGQ